jgi:hypothetical protein
MTDPIVLIDATAAAALLAAVAVLLPRLLGRPQPHPSVVAVAAALGVGAAYALGAWVLGLRPNLNVAEDKDRLLALVLPAVLAVELVAAVPRFPWWLAWPLRMAVAAAAAPALLHGSTYITDLPGAPRQWAPDQAWQVLGGLAAALAAVWALLAWLARRAPGPATPLSLGLACGAAAATVKFSGSVSEGDLGVPLAGALIGVGLALLVLPGARARSAVGVGVVGLFSLLVVGVLFADLTLTNAALLFAAPLAGWLPELPYVRRLPAWVRGVAAVALVLLAASYPASQAEHKFREDTRPSSDPREPTLDDYRNYHP